MVLSPLSRPAADDDRGTVVPLAPGPRIDGPRQTEVSAVNRRTLDRRWIVVSVLVHLLLLEALLLGLREVPRAEPVPILNITLVRQAPGGAGAAGGNGGSAGAGSTAAKSTTAAASATGPDSVAAAPEIPPPAPEPATTPSTPQPEMPPPTPPSPEIPKPTPPQPEMPPPAPEPIQQPTPPPPATPPQPMAMAPALPRVALEPPPPPKPRYMPPRPPRRALAQAMPAPGAPPAAPKAAPARAGMATALATPGAGAGPGGVVGHGKGAEGAGKGAIGNTAGPGDDYLERLYRHLLRYKTYPPQAISEKRQGSVVIGFTIARDGAVSDVHVERSSGSAVLDEATVAMLRRASPVPPLPATYRGGEARVKFPIDYKLGLLDQIF